MDIRLEKDDPVCVDIDEYYLSTRTMRKNDSKMKKNAWE